MHALISILAMVIVSVPCFGANINYLYVNNARFGSASTPAAPFNANSISNLSGWWIADSITGANGDGIGTCPDASSNANHLIQGTAGKRPILETSAINGHASMWFNGTNALTSSNAVDLSGSNCFTLFMVSSNVTPPAAEVVLQHSTSYTATASFRIERKVDTIVGTNNWYLNDYSGGYSAFDTTRRNEDAGFVVYSWMVDRSISSRVSFLLNNATWEYFDGVQADGSNAQNTYRNDTRNYPSGALYVGTHSGLTGGFHGHIAEIIFYARRLTMAEKDSVDRYLMTKYARYAGINGIVICDGDSMTAGTATLTPYPNQLMPMLTNRYHWGNYGIGSLTMTNWHGVTPYNENFDLSNYGTNKVFCFWLGSNDFAFGNSTNSVQTTMTNICNTIRGWGYNKIVVATITKRGDTSIETKRLSYNEWLRNNYTYLADGLCDLASHGNFQDPEDTTYFTADKVHFTDLGQGIVAAMFKTNLNALGVY